MNERKPDELPVVAACSAGDWTDDFEEIDLWRADETRKPMLFASHKSATNRIASLQAENAKLRTVMIAAAEEIQAHWDAHCDAEGYGPQNLMRRLEEGIPAEYSYTAGAFEELKARAEAAEQQVQELREAIKAADDSLMVLEGIGLTYAMRVCRDDERLINLLLSITDEDAAIDAAKKGEAA
jgi:hypothetical protein